ncbi:MAG: hypothetical protein KJ069_32175 [Anaerolineae bacterium]|nr:hypothetical protein [Anaerolineae bacterium]
MNYQTQDDDQTQDDARNTTQVKGTMGQMQQKAGEVASEVQQQVGELSQQAKEEAKSTFHAQKAVAAQELHGVAQALRQTGSQLREQDQTLFAQYSNRVADHVERASTYLEEHELDDLVFEAEDFARRQPELFIGGAFMLGLLAARFLKSSAPTRPETSLGQRPQSRARGLATYPTGSHFPAGTTPQPIPTARPRG